MLLFLLLHKSIIKTMEAMQLRFEGQDHCIDADTLISVLSHYKSVVSETNMQYGGGAREIRLQVNALEKGSFIVDISVVQGFVKQLFSSDAVNYIAGLVAIVGGVYSAYKALKGKPARTKEDVEKIEDSTTLHIKGDVYITIGDIINVYNQPVVREAISKTVEKVDSDPSAEGFSISNRNGEKDIVHFSRSEFKDYIYSDFDKEENIPEERIIDEIATLTIVGLNFERNAQWQFMYNGFKIRMIVKDDALMKQINDGARFGKGDAIRVKLRRIQVYNKEYKAYENKSYKIVEFYNIVTRQEGDLFENAE